MITDHVNEISCKFQVDQLGIPTRLFSPPQFDPGWNYSRVERQLNKAVTTSIISIEIRPDVLSFAGISAESKNIKVKCVAIVGANYHRSNEISVETLVRYPPESTAPSPPPKRARELGRPIAAHQAAVNSYIAPSSTGSRHGPFVFIAGLLLAFSFL